MEKTKRFVPNIWITYCGRVLDNDKVVHVYRDEEGQKDFIFKNKLQRAHLIGYKYPVLKKGNSFVTRHKDCLLAKASSLSMKKIAEFRKLDEDVSNYMKAKRELSSLKKLARKAAISIKPQYHRCSREEKVAKVNEFIEELETI